MKPANAAVIPFPKAVHRDRDELAFLPAALEIVETPPSPTGRAIAMRWRWPPDSDTPRSPIDVSYPCGILQMNSWAPARRAAATTRSSDIAGSTSAMFSRTERLNRMFS